VLDLFKNQRHRFNIKERGIMPVIGMARVLALDIRYLESSNTFDRLRRVGHELPELSERASALLDAYQYLVDFRLEHQLRAVEAGEEPGDELDLSALSQNQRDLLYNALNKLGELHDVLARRYGV
jgi:CBS domain-containing protein